MKKSQVCILWLVVTLLSFGGSLAAQNKANLKKISYEQAFQQGKPLLLKPMATIKGWLDDEHYLVEPVGDKKRPPKLYKVEAKTGKKTIFLDFAALQEKFPKGLQASRYAAVTKDFHSFLYLFKNDLYFFSVKHGKLKRLTATLSPEKNPRFSPDGKLVAFTRDHNLYALNIDKRLEYQLTSDGSETIYNGWASWVYYEEILGRRSHYAAFWWSPDSKKIAFLRFDDSPVPTFPLVHSGGVHPQLELERYPKAGDPNPKVKLGLALVEEGKVIWIDIGNKIDSYLAWPFWLPDSSQLAFQWMNRDQDKIKIYAFDLATKKSREIYDESQSTWVDFFKDLYFFKDRSGFLLRSDTDGWSHLYYYDLNGNLKQRLTSGPWSVINIALVDEKSNVVFFQARKNETTESHLWQVKLDGSYLKRITTEPGLHRVLISPKGSYFIDYFTNIHTPLREDLYRRDGTFVRNIDHSRTHWLEKYAIPQKELLFIPCQEGIKLPAYWILPPDFDQNKKYPILFTIYGGPGSMTVTNSYPSLSSLYLAQEGIIIFSIDHRGSGHFGKQGQALMHRCLGHWEMHDLIEAIKWLKAKSFIDKTKIGITGGSYGGYTTCLALTYGADYFSHGYARSSVTDWKLYDTVYTERYMDKPCENKEGYEMASVLTHAPKLKGVLFLSHGDIDDNVHPQNTIQLMDKLIDLQKPFEFKLYPNQRHGFRGKKRTYSNRDYVNFWFKHFLNRCEVGGLLRTAEPTD